MIFYFYHDENLAGWPVGHPCFFIRVVPGPLLYSPQIGCPAAADVNFRNVTVCLVVIANELWSTPDPLARYRSLRVS